LSDPLPAELNKPQITGESHLSFVELSYCL